MNMAGGIHVTHTLKSLWRQKYVSVLIIIQIAVTMAVVSNGLFIMENRSRVMQNYSGMDEQNTFHVTSFGFKQDFNAKDAIERDLDALRHLPGVVGVIKSNSMPLSDSGTWVRLQGTAGEQQNSIDAALYKVDEHALQTLDLALIAGQNFSPNDVKYVPDGDNSWPASAIITLATAKGIAGEGWPDLIGKTIFVEGSTPLVIKGIVDKLHAPWVEWASLENTLMIPVIEANRFVRYIIRTEPGQLFNLLPKVEEMLSKSNKDRTIRNVKTVASARSDIFARDRAIMTILSTVMLILTTVTAAGIAGLGSFNVSKRRQQIGIRRALGACKGDIMRQFMFENLLLSFIGSGLGVVFAVMLNIMLVNHYGLAAINWLYLPSGMLLLLVLGQLAVFLPAYKASSVSPALATRSL